MKKKNYISLLLDKTWFWLLVALLFRLPGITQSLWLDEAIQAFSTSFSLRSLFSYYMPGDFNPPLYHILTWVLVRIFGNSVVVLRLPSLLAGVGIVWIGRRWLLDHFKDDKLFIRIGTVLLITAPLLTYYAQETRPYEIAFIFSAALLLVGNNTARTISTG